MSSSHSGTIGRKRGGSSSASEFYFGNTNSAVSGAGGGGGGGGSGSGTGSLGGGEKMRRQRSAEWHSRHGYGSSSEDEYQNTGQQASAFDTQLLAQLLLQSQQLASLDRYGSDCENETSHSSLLAEFPHSLREAGGQRLQQQNTGLCSPVKQQPPAAAAHSSGSSGGGGGSMAKYAAQTAQPAPARSTNPFLNAKYDSHSNSDSTSERLSYAGSSIMLDRLQATGGGSGAAADVGAPPSGAAAAALTAAFLMPTSSTASSLNPGGSRAHRSKSGRTLSRANGAGGGVAGVGGMTSSSSGTSSNSNVTAAVAAAMATRNEREKLKLQQIQMELREFAQATATDGSVAQAIGVGEAAGAAAGAHGDFDVSGSESEPPPEPAPPEIPPRTQSLLMSLRKHSDYKLKYEDKGGQKHEEFIPTSQLQQQIQKDYLIADSSRSSESQSKSIASSDSQSQQG